MELKIYQVDAFTDKLFAGNPAAVCPLDAWIDAELMQRIAAENNLAETAFFVRNKNVYEIRWFMPHDEIDLCGHATLASAFVIFNDLKSEAQTIHFTSQSGPLVAQKEENGSIVLDFPSRPPKEIPIPKAVFSAFNYAPVAAAASRDLVLLFRSEEEISTLTYDLNPLKSLPYLGIIATAKGDTVDFVSRVFDANATMPEDPVTGSSHCSLTPYWHKKLNKKVLKARQLSERTGDLLCTLDGGRVYLAGKAVLYSKGTIYFPG
ncbi:MAG: PhzF family phenazine biosynthesis protein [Bacteroidota bacterium]